MKLEIGLIKVELEPPDGDFIRSACAVTVADMAEHLHDPQEVRALGQFLQSLAGIMDAERRVRRG